jgi:myo-inositol 2-dehydrogenase/D-chiro-inositol 1-dehydrogenase
MTATLTLPHGLIEPALLSERDARGNETITEFAHWDPHAAILAVLADAKAGGPAHPNLDDATRATEVAEAVVRSLRRGRTVDLYYEDVSEAGTFKSVMTSLGCVVLLAVLGVIPLALAGPALGLPWTIYIAYAIPVVLVAFVFVQLFRFAIREPADAGGFADSSPPE